MKIFTAGNKSEEKFLRRRAADFDFSKFNRKETALLVKNMREIMKKADGIGLAANQIGLDRRVFTASVGGKFYVIFNPEIIKVSRGNIFADEGCLSVPGAFGNVGRAEKITLVGQDRNGKKIKIRAWGLLARVFQHEVDHLNGMLFIDKAENIYKLKSQIGK